MQTHYYCPGKIAVTDTESTVQFYISKDKKLSYCSYCFHKYKDKIDTKQFELSKNNKYYCMWNVDFSDSSLVLDDIRVSIVNPENYYRYNKQIIDQDYNNGICVGINNNSKFMVVIENISNEPKHKISLSSIVHNNEVNTYYANLESDCIIVKYMSYNHDLIFDDSNYRKKHIIKLSINKWKQQIIEGTPTYILDKESVDFSIHLVRKKEDINVVSYNSLVLVNNYI